MAIKIKTIRGRQYRYSDASTRVNGKVVTKSLYLGPVKPIRKRRGGFPTLGIPTVVMGALLVAGLAMKGRLGPPGGNAFKEKPYDPLQREKHKAQLAVEKLDRKYGIDKTNADTFRASRARLPKEMLQEHFSAERSAWRTVDAERPKGEASSDMKEFAARMAQVQREQAERHAAKSSEEVPTENVPAGDKAEANTN